MEFTRGNRTVFQLTVENDIDLNELGTPTVVLSQDNRTVALDISSIEGKVITCVLTAAKSLLFVADLPTFIQQSWNDGDGGILIFPEHEVQVMERFNEIVVDTSIDTDVEYDETPDYEEPDEDYDEVSGDVYEEYDELNGEEEDDDEGFDDVDVDDDAGGEDYDPSDPDDEEEWE